MEIALQIPESIINSSTDPTDYIIDEINRQIGREAFTRTSYDNEPFQTELSTFEENVPDFIIALINELNDNAPNDITITSRFITSTYDESTYNIDYFDGQYHFGACHQMEQFRYQLKHNPFLPQKQEEKTFALELTDELKEFILTRFETLNDIYAFESNMFDDCTEIMGNHAEYPDDDAWMSCTSPDINETFYTYDDEQFTPPEMLFYYGNTENRKFLILVDDGLKRILFLHKRTNEIQTFIITEDGSGTDLMECMFVHDTNDGVIMYKRYDNLYIDADNNTCEQCKVKTYKVEFV